MMSNVEDQEENPAEPVPDVMTVAEPPQPPEPTLEDDETHSSLLPISSSHLQSDPPTLSNSEENQQQQLVVSGNTADEDSPSFVPSSKECKDNFAQTFVKYAKNLSNRRLAQILNTPVDHQDRFLIFYCASEDLLQSFEYGVTQRKI